jgi:hypothetical protein
MINQILQLEGLPEKLREYLQKTGQFKESVVNRYSIIEIYSARRDLFLGKDEYSKVVTEIDNLIQNLKKTEEDEINLVLIDKKENYFILFTNKNVDTILGCIDMTGLASRLSILT